MSKKIKSATFEAIFEDGSTQKLEVTGHVDIQTKLAYINPAKDGPFAKLGRTITFKDVPESQITEVITRPTVLDQHGVHQGAVHTVHVAPLPAPRPEPRFAVGDIVSLPGSHRFAGRPKTTPSHYRVKDVFWLRVNGRWGVTLETRYGKEIGSPDLSQMSVLTKADRFPLRRGDFVRAPSGLLFKIAEKNPANEGHFWVIKQDGTEADYSLHESILTVVPHEKIKVTKTFEVAE